MSEPGRVGGTPEQPARFFADAQEFSDWLTAQHDSASELWMGLRSKHAPKRGLTWEDAVGEALCWGWIDSRAERIDELSRRQRWTPRRHGSTWSTVNIATAQRLIEQGRMQPTGLAAFEARRADRSGTYAYEQDLGEFPAEYADSLAISAAATASWDSATPAYRKIATSWVLSAKQAVTRERRMAQLVTSCTAGELIKSQRYGSPPKWAESASRAAAAARGAAQAGAT